MEEESAGVEEAESISVLFRGWNPDYTLLCQIMATDHSIV